MKIANPSIQKFSLALNHRKIMKENTHRFCSRIHSKKISVSEEFYTKENLFHRLPTELIISIFDRILDTKYLFICCSVSKYFASHVLQTRYVSVEIPCTVGQSGRDVVVWPHGVENFLKKLCCVESAIIKFALHDPNPNSSQQICKPLVWWKSNSIGFILVSTPSRVASSDAGITSIIAARRFIDETVNHVRDFKSRFRYVQELLVLLPNIKNISAVDSMKKGSIVLEEGIAGMIKKGKPLEGRVESCRKSRIIRKVMLPLSGCVTMNVAHILNREIGRCDGFAENLLEENEYREIAMTMTKDRRDSSAVGGTAADDVSKMPLMLIMSRHDFHTKFVDTI